MNQIRAERESALEGKIEDRQLKIFSLISPKIFDLFEQHAQQSKQDQKEQGTPLFC